MGADRLRESLLSIIDAATRRTRFHARVRARVVEVLGDGRVSTMPESPGTPPLPALPLRFGLPGVLRAIGKAGARVVVGWAEGDPAQPYVAAWDASQLEELVFDVDGGAEPLARTGDSVACGTLAFNTSGATLTITYTAPSGATQQVSLTVPGVSGSGTLTLTGRVTGSSVIQG